MKVSDLYGLILVGGQSVRMGEDKLSIEYHGKPQLEHLLEIMNKCLEQTFVSTRRDQPIGINVNVIEDAYDVRGPLNGLLSAHKTSPDKAWLVLAIDMPLVNARTIRRLIDNRDTSKLATAYVKSSDGLPEPLAAIWEPKALDRLMMNAKNDSPIFPRKFLIDNHVKLVQAVNTHELFNVNTEVDLGKAKSLIRKRSL